MQKFQKAVLMLLCAVLLSCTFSGCGNDQSNDGYTEVTMWSSDSGGKAIVMGLVDEFNKTIGEQNKIRLVYEVKENNLSQQIEIALKTGKAPDIFTGIALDAGVDNGYLQPLEEMPGGAEYLKRYEGKLTEGWHQYNGKTYCVPYACSVFGLAYNKDMFKAAGIVDENGEAKPPETLAEMRAYAQQLTNPAKRQYGIIFPVKWSGWFAYDLKSCSMSVTGSNGYDPKTGTYDYMALKPMLDTVIGIQSDESYYPGAEGLDNDAARARFADGNIGMKFAVSWDVNVWNTQFPAKCDWGIAPIPVEDVNNKYKQMRIPSFSPYINAATADEKGEAIMTVYKWWTGDELLQKRFAEGQILPWDESIMEGVDLSDSALKGFEDLVAIMKISVDQKMAIKTDTSGYEGIGAEFINYVWTDKTMTVDELLQKYTKIENDGIEKYKETHPDYDPSPSLDPNWDIRRD